MGFLERFKARSKEITHHKRELRKEDLFLRIQQRLSEEFKLDKEKIKLESRLKEDLGLDSVDAIQVIMVLEEEFDFEIPDSDAEKISVIEQIVDYVYARLYEKG